VVYALRRHPEPRLDRGNLDGLLTGTRLDSAQEWRKAVFFSRLLALYFPLFKRCEMCENGDLYLLKIASSQNSSHG